MNLINKSIKAASLGLLFGAITFFSGCMPEEFDVNNGLTDTNFAPSFTIEPVSGRNNTFVLKADKQGLLDVKWNKGLGGGMAAGRGIDTVYYPFAGDFTITLQAVGRGGVTATTAKTLNVPQSDPNAVNVIKGGKLEEGDEQYWTPLSISPGVTFEIADGKMVASGGNWGHAGIYQAITVNSKKKYKFGMKVSGNGAADTWFEVYFGKTAPVNNSDYSDGGKKFGLNTWNGCGKKPFDGDLAIIGCDAALADKNGDITFPESGTVYFLIKSGGADLGNGGISIDDITLIEY